MADPVPIAATQAAILKSAAGKAGQGSPVQSTQAGAVRQDLAVMADQAKGYTAGVNAGVITAQDNRAAQARRLAVEKQQADAARAREAQMQAIQMQEAQLRQQAQSADFTRRKEQAQMEQLNKQQEPDEANAQNVLIHMAKNTSTGFQTAFQELMSYGATNPRDVLAILDNINKEDDSPYQNVSRDALRRYSEAYFKALEGKAIAASSLDPKKNARRTDYAATAPTEEHLSPGTGRSGPKSRRFGF